MTRKKKTEETVDEEANRKALDEIAGVAPVSSVKPVERFPGVALPTREVTRPANAQPLVTTDTKEKLLYKIASTGTPIGNEFFDQFPDVQEILTLALSISVRQLVIAMCNPDLAATQRIAAMRTVIALSGKPLPAEEDETNAATRPAPLAIPTGSKADVTRTLEAIRRVSSETPDANG
jgi:hypothetical protein